MSADLKDIAWATAKSIFEDPSIDRNFLPDVSDRILQVLESVTLGRLPVVTQRKLFNVVVPYGGYALPYYIAAESRDEAEAWAEEKGGALLPITEIGQVDILVKPEAEAGE